MIVLIRASDKVDLGSPSSDIASDCGAGENRFIASQLFQNELFG
jgi:hypothetical protein